MPIDAFLAAQSVLGFICGFEELAKTIVKRVPRTGIHRPVLQPGDEFQGAPEFAIYKKLVELKELFDFESDEVTDVQHEGWDDDGVFAVQDCVCFVRDLVRDFGWPLDLDIATLRKEVSDRRSRLRRLRQQADASRTEWSLSLHRADLEYRPHAKTYQELDNLVADAVAPQRSAMERLEVEIQGLIAAPLIEGAGAAWLLNSKLEEMRLLRLRLGEFRPRLEKIYEAEKFAFDREMQEVTDSLDRRTAEITAQFDAKRTGENGIPPLPKPAAEGIGSIGGTLVKEKPESPADQAKRDWKNFKALAELTTTPDSNPRIHRESIVERSKTGHHDSPKNRASFKRLVARGMITSPRKGGTGLTEAGERAWESQDYTAITGNNRQ